MYFVLMDTNQDGSGTPIGVFDTPNISNDALAEYFGDFEVIQEMDIRDIGLEWQKVIKWDEGKATLTLHYFSLNELD